METTRSIGTSDAVGAAIRDERRAQRLTQAQLAKKARVSHDFLIELEEGHSDAALGKVLDVFGALGLKASVALASDRVSDPEVEQTLAVIEKGQRLAGHFPSDEAIGRARRVLEGRTTLADARAELAAEYDRREG